MELQRRVDAQADKLDREYVALMRLLDDDLNDQTITLVLSQSKRIRRESGILVQQLAKLRDNLQPQKGTR